MQYASFNIIIPVYNEGPSIIDTIKLIGKAVKSSYKIIIIYDFPEDSTIPMVKNYIEQNQAVPINLIQNKHGKGPLQAIKTGLEHMPDLPSLVTMADLSDDPYDIDIMFKIINEGSDIVCGSRYMKGGKQEGSLFIEGLLSRYAGLTLHYLAGIPTHDATNSFKMYAPTVLKSLKIESTGGFSLGMELVIKAHLKHFKISEIPTKWKDRSVGKSKFKLVQWLPQYLRWYFFALYKNIFKP